MSSPALGQAVGSCELGLAEATLDINGVSAAVYNTGELFGREPNEPRYNVPAGSPHHAIYRAHIWIAGLVGGELRATASTGGLLEMWPGPISNIDDPPENCSEYDRIFKVSREDLETLAQFGTATADIQQWPWQLGAPVDDGDGIADNYDMRAGDRPRIEGDQTLWWIMNDVGNEHEWSQTPPLGVEVRVTAYASHSEGEALEYTTFYQFEMTNRSHDIIDEIYFGMHVDPDVGDWSDDYVGSDTTYGVAFAYNGDDFDGRDIGYGDRPPAIGVTVLDGPVVERYGRRMTNFMTFLTDDSRWDERTGWAAPTNGLEAYNFLRSRWGDGTPLKRFSMPGWRNVHEYLEPPVGFLYPGRPPQFFSESDIIGAGYSNVPGDRRFIWSTGPFRLAPGGSTRIVVAVIWAQGVDRFDSIYKMIDQVPDVREAYANRLGTSAEDHGLGLPTALELKPPYPNPSNGPRSLVYGVPGQQRVSLAVYDLLGRRVDVVSDGDRTAGWHTETWDPKALSAGVYFVTLEADTDTRSQPIVVIR